MTPKIDSIDQMIIKLLMEDGRMSSAEIARRVTDISERAIHHRVERLLQQGTIRVSAIVDPRVVGYAVRADILLDVAPGQISAVAERLVNLEQVHFVACSFGNFDVTSTVYARDNAELYKFIAETIMNIPGVESIDTTLTPLVLKDIFDWRIPMSSGLSKMEPFFPRQVGVYEINQEDREITHLLIEDGRMPATEIARRLGNITARAVRERIETLTRQGVFRVSAIVAPETVGFPVRADAFLKINTRHVLAVAETLAVCDETTYVGCSIGVPNLSIQFCARDNMDVFRFVTEVVHSIPEVDGTIITLVPLILKDAYDWRIPASVCVDR